MAGKETQNVASLRGGVRVMVVGAVREPPSQVVDPTGAGDAYRGGLISGLLRGKDIKESARMGSACASFAVESYGTQSYSFTAKEFEERVGTL